MGPGMVRLRRGTVSGLGRIYGLSVRALGVSGVWKVGVPST